MELLAGGVRVIVRGLGLALLLSTSAIAQSELPAMVYSAQGGTYLYPNPTQPGGYWLANGTQVALAQLPSPGSVLVGARTASGLIGYVAPSSLAALTSSYMPSAVTPGMYVPAGASAGSQWVGLQQQQGTYTPQGYTGTGAALSGPGTVGLLGVGSGGANGGFVGTGAAPGGGGVRVIGTAQEGKGRSASGVTLTRTMVFAALPSRSALGRTVAFQLCDVQGRAYGTPVAAPVVDVGPWQTRDDYFSRNSRPLAESYRGQRVAWNRQYQGWFPGSGTLVCNGAGIDLSEASWQRLVPGLSSRQALTQMSYVNWWFAR